MCHRCLGQMQDDEGEAVSVPSSSGPGITIYVHRRSCTPAPQQTSPSDLGR